MQDFPNKSDEQYVIKSSKVRTIHQASERAPILEEKRDLEEATPNKHQDRTQHSEKARRFLASERRHPNKLVTSGSENPCAGTAVDSAR